MQFYSSLVCCVYVSMGSIGTTKHLFADVDVHETLHRFCKSRKSYLVILKKPFKTRKRPTELNCTVHMAKPNVLANHIDCT